MLLNLFRVKISDVLTLNSFFFNIHNVAGDVINFLQMEKNLFGSVFPNSFWYHTKHLSITTLIDRKDLGLWPDTFLVQYHSNNLTLLRVIENIKKYSKFSGNTLNSFIYDVISTQKNQLILRLLRGPSSSLKIWAKIQRKMPVISVLILIWSYLLNRCSF